MSASARDLTIVLVAALGLGGCVSLLPKTTPSQLYRFGVGVEGEPTTASSPPIAAPRPSLGAVTLPRATAGDGILTVRGDEVAYIAGARWVSPAVDLLREAAERALSSPEVAQVAASLSELSLEGRSFEARYAVADAAPTVRVTLHAALSRRDGRRFAERTFTAEAPAAANRVGAIVGAYDVAVAATLRAVVAWSGQNGAPAAP